MKCNKDKNLKVIKSDKKQVYSNDLKNQVEKYTSVKNKILKEREA